MSQVTLEKIVALCKRRGFAYPSAEIYGGLNGIYDFGHLGYLMKNNIKSFWKQSISCHKEDIVFFDGAIVGSERVWDASGHLKNFSDPMVDCLNCKKRFRADEISTEKSCSACGVKSWTEPRQFMLMLETSLGAMTSQSSRAFLRPETAQTIFANFKNIYSTSRVKIPFGVAQIGKAFRNEITPKQFLFRVREFEQMELEFFCSPQKSKDWFDTWLERRKQFYKDLGINQEKLRFRSHEKNEMAHYSSACTDAEYQFPFGWKELEGIAHRGSYDLSAHQSISGKELSVFDEKTNEKFIPEVIECSLGVDRILITCLFDAYKEEEIEGGTRTVLALNRKIAPIKACVMPLVKKLSEPAEKIYRQLLKKNIQVEYDLSGSIGKRYRRQDEIGTPFCITYDFDSQTDNKVTVRNRDNLEQIRIDINQIVQWITNALE